MNHISSKLVCIACLFLFVVGTVEAQKDKNTKVIAATMVGAKMASSKSKISELSVTGLFKGQVISLDNEIIASLDKVFLLMSIYPAMKIEVSNYTNSKGDSQKSMKMSQKRAKAAFDYLVNCGIDPSRMTTSGYALANMNMANLNSPHGESEIRVTNF